MPKTPEPEKYREIVIKARVIEPGEKWHSKEEIAALEQASLKFWNELEDDNRQAVVVLTRDALLRLIEGTDLWIPTSLEPKSGNRLDLYISIHFAEIDEEVVRRRVETEREIYQTREDLVALSGELATVEPAPGATP